MAANDTGHAYVAGRCYSPTFPTTTASFKATSRGNTDAFVTKIDTTVTTGSAALIYSAFLGGSLYENCWDIAIDAAGYVYVAGDTSSTNLSVTTGAYQTTRNGPSDAFVAVLSPSGGSLVYSTYFGGSGDDTAQGIALNAQGGVHIAGKTKSSDFPLAGNPVATTASGVWDPFAARLEIGPAVVTINPPGQQYGGGPITITGTESIPGATIQVDLLDANGNVVATGFATLNADGTWTITFTNVPPGTYTIRIIVTNPNTGQQTTIIGGNPIIVDPNNNGQGGFSLSPSAISATVLLPDGVTTGSQTVNASPQIVITATGGFRGQVLLSAFPVGTVPSGITVSLAPASVTFAGGTSATSTLSFTVSNAVNPGIYSFTVQGTSGNQSGSATTTATVTVRSAQSPAIDEPPPLWAIGVVPVDSAGGNAGAFGPSAGDTINLASGVYENRPEPDIVVHNPIGPDVTLTRMYRSPLSATAGYGSPGLATGWITNYDIQIVNNGSGNLTLVYPNGAVEAITVTSDGSGGGPAGAPYVVTGTAGSTSGQWNDITLTYSDETHWKFTPFSQTGTSGPIVYRLNQISDRLNRNLLFYFNTAGALRGITATTTGTSLSYTLLSITDNGLQDYYGRRVDYNYSGSCLSSVSVPYYSGPNGPQTRWSYAYTVINGKYFLNHASVPNPNNDPYNPYLSNTVNYDPVSGFVTSVVDANGNKHTYTYHSGNSTDIVVTNSSNAVVESWKQKIGSHNHNIGTTDANSNTTTSEYNDTNSLYLVTDFTNENGQKTHVDFDLFGKPKKLTNSRNVDTVINYETAAFKPGRLSSIQVGNLVASSVVYGSNGLPATVLSPMPGGGTGTVQTVYTYSTLNNVTSVSVPAPNDLGQNVAYTYNYTHDDLGPINQTETVGQPITITDPLGHVTHYRYDSQGNVTAIIDAAGNRTDFVYNEANQLTYVILPATNMTGSGRMNTAYVYAYPGGPLLQTLAYNESNPAGGTYNRGTGLIRTTTQEFGLESESKGDSGAVPTVKLNFDGSYRVTGVADGGGTTHKTAQAFDAVGDMTAINYPIGGNDRIQFPGFSDGGHDAAGNVLKRIDGKNVTTQYQRATDDSRITQVTYSGLANRTVNLNYDSYSRLTTQQDGEGSYTYAYDDLNNLISATTKYSYYYNFQPAPTKTVSYTYYPDGHRKSMAIDGVGTFTYAYDLAGRMVGLTSPKAEGTFSWTYYDNNWVKTQTLGNAVTTTYTYDAIGQKTGQITTTDTTTATQLEQYGLFLYDGHGNLLSYKEGPGNNVWTATFYYTYDEQDRLIDWDAAVGVQGGAVIDYEGYTGYDNAGNPTFGGNQSYSVNNQAANGEIYTNSYDLNGNTLSTRSANRSGYSTLNTTFSYDEENNFVSKRGFGSNQNNYASVNAYRSDGLRSRTLDPEFAFTSPKNAYFIYDGTTPVVEMNGVTVYAVNTFGPTGLLHRWENRDVVNGLSTTPYSLFYTFDPEGTTSYRYDAAGAAIGSTGNVSATTSRWGFGGGISNSFYQNPASLDLGS